MSTANHSDRTGPPPTIRGYEYAEVISALQKAIRRSNPEEALYWSTELEASNYGEALWRRLRVICSEDIGLGSPLMPAVIHALYLAWTDARKRKDDKQRSWRLFTTHAVLALVTAPKSRTIDHALLTFWGEVDRGDAPRLPIPDLALDKHTLAGKKRGRGWKHFFEEGSLLVDPATGELGDAPSGVPDAYRERARAAVEVTR